LKITSIFVNVSIMNMQSHPRLVQFMPLEKGAIVTFSGYSTFDVANIMSDFFISNGFNLDSGTSSVGVYSKGSGAGRALLGGFVDRKKYSLRIWVDQSFVNAQIESEMTGASGSVLGVVRERKGRDEIKDSLQFFLQRFPR